MTKPKLFVSHHRLLSNTALQLTQTVSLSNTDVEFAGAVRNLGFIFDCDLSLKPHIIKAYNVRLHTLESDA